MMDCKILDILCFFFLKIYRASVNEKVKEKKYMIEPLNAGSNRNILLCKWKGISQVAISSTLSGYIKAPQPLRAGILNL